MASGATHELCRSPFGSLVFNLDQALDVETNPDFLDDGADFYLNSSQGGLDRDRAVTTRDSGLLASDEAAATDRYFEIRARVASLVANDDED